MTDIQTMTDGYLEAIYFTETGDKDQPDADSELDAYTKMQAYIDCRNFWWAVTEELGIPSSVIDWRQAGIDLWLTRNGHGAGFWDRPELYGDDAKTFSALAKAMGGHDANFQE